MPFPHAPDPPPMEALGTIVELEPALQDTSRRVEGGRIGLPAITPAHLQADGSIDFSDLRKVFPEGDLKRQTRYAIAEGDLVFTLRVPIRCCVVERIPRTDSKVGILAVGALGIARLGTGHPDGRVNAEYLAWCLGQDRILRSLETRNAGAIAHLLSLRELRDLEIPVPTPSVQRRISQALAAQRRLEAVLTRYLDASRRRTDALVSRILTPADRDTRGPRRSS